MVFYRLEGVAESVMGIEGLSEESGRIRVREASRHLGHKCEAFNLTLKGSACVFISEITDSIVTVGMILKDEQNVSALTDQFMDHVGIRLSEVRLEETTYGNLKNMLVSADRRDFISDAEEIVRKFGLTYLNNRFGNSLDYEEDIIDIKTKRNIYASAKKLLSNEGILCELDRIYEGKKGKSRILGHPVHYLLQSDSASTLDEMNRILLQALYANDRLRNKRTCKLEIGISRREPPKKAYDCLYQSCVGGAVQVLFLAEGEEEEDGFASAYREYVEAICEVIKRYKNKVLTIFCIPAQDHRINKYLREYLDRMTFISLQETSVTKERALGCLKDMAREYGVRVDDRLKAMLNREDGYYAGDLQQIFDEWHDAKLKKDLYPQYGQAEVYRKATARRKATGLAYEELMEMAGIDEAKKVIQRAVAYRKAQKLLAGEGIHEERFSMHMVFTGNPGTAKTTVARLLARILKENGLVDTGVFIEAGRGDLVGKYVGWTAKIIQKKFQDAVGGVLFIDEAYALLDGRSGSFGDEAINTIVQEMENHRKDVITVFAGYPEQMEEFLDRNPGLRSRIAFYVPFPDYDVTQLCEIADYTAKKMGLVLNSDARGKLDDIFRLALRSKNFGNGRYVRNILEKARMKQLTRLLETEYATLSREDMSTIRACDIEVPGANVRKVSQIGFLAPGYS